MTDISSAGNPIFMELANDQLPITFSQLINSDITEPTANIDVAPSAYEVSSSEEKSNEQLEATNACIKIEKRRLKCPECKRFTCETEEKMVRHIRKQHRGENPFQCYMCDYSTYNKAVFEEHVRIHQGIKPFKCSYCKYRSASKKNTKKHELIHRADNPLRCQDCDFIGKNPQSLGSHKKKVHSGKNSTNVLKNYTCEICEREFSDRNKRNRHQRLSKKCAICDFVSCSRLCYNTHLKDEHDINIPKTKESKLFTCSLCPWSSSSKPRILLHLIHHPNQMVNEDVIDITILRNCGIMR